MTAAAPAAPLYLLDTNILVHCVRHDALGRRQWKWGGQKADQMNYYLDHLRKIPIERPEIMEAYALIDATSEATGFTMGKNDLWIAAVARVTSATLLTTDKDFDHLDGAFLTRVRVEPDA